MSESEGEREKEKKYIEHLYVVNLNRKCVNKESEVSVTEWWQKNSTITGIVAEKKHTSLKRCRGVDWWLMKTILDRNSDVGC